MADNNKMLIDAAHPEETRVVVLRGGRVEEFDYESAARKLLRGNIYLAKVTRVEPALQAAFVDYGGNRHGFLAFNEIHPDYYQIPVADRLALIEEEAAIEAEEEAEADARAERMEKRRSRPRRGGRGRSDRSASNAKDDETVEDDHDDASSDADEDNQSDLVEAAGADDDNAPHEEFMDTASSDTSDDDGEAEVEVASASENEASDEPTANDDGLPVEEETAEAATEDGDASSDDGDDATPPKTIAQSMERDDVLKSEPGEHAAASDQPDGDDKTAATESTPEEIAQVEATTDSEPAGEATNESPPALASDADEPVAKDLPQDDDDNGDDGDSDDDDDDDDDSDDTDNGDENGDAAESNGDADAPEEVATDTDALEELPARTRRSRRSYKIQEVIKRRQVLLIQVVKEERGNKGAALTTYLSLAGRYTVLMPNTARGGGISRKITNPQDRKRLKAIAAELEVPEGMGLIIRTAGAARTKQEIRRDFEYLLRLWESVRDLTLQSTAPSLVYEEGDLIKRSIRDLYNKEVDEIIVAGDEAHRNAKDFMRMLMPSHAKNVTLYNDPEPLFTRYQIERQLNAMFSPHVTLKSGGYMVINQTEALVAVDINSGRSTREFSIEETALHTNLEAADEIARQLKLRDLAGLIVIDFIDMEEKRNNRAVERRLKEALRFDRARIQVGRISHFGLLEMSRQRMRTGVLEGSTSQCPHCQGTGIIRSTESVALAVLRGLEDAVTSRSRGALVATTTAEVALYILNNKREFVIDMEKRHGWPIVIQASDKLAGANFNIEKGPASPELKQQQPRRPERTAAVSMDWGFDEEEPTESGSEARNSNGADRSEDGEDGNGRRKRRRRRRGRRSGERTGEGETQANAEDDSVDDRDANDDSGEDDVDTENAEAANGENGDGDTRPRRGRRRGRRGGRRNRERPATNAETAAAENDNASSDGDEEGDNIPGLGPQPSLADAVTAIPQAGGQPQPDAADTAENSGSDEQEAASERPARPPRRRRTRSTTPRNETNTSDDTGIDAGAEPATVEAAATDSDTAPAVEVSAETAETQAPTGIDAEKGEDAPPVEEPRRPRHPPTSSAPRLERVKVGPADTVANGDTEAETTSAEASEDTTADEPDAKPTRRGWWQRRLLGE